MVTVKEIAKMCGVSASTVSNILNGKPNVGEDTRQRVLRAIEETGYHTNYFASNMRKQNTQTISVIVEDLTQFTTPPIVEEIMSYCEERGYRTIMMNMRMYDRWQNTWYGDEQKVKSVLNPILQEIESIRVDGNIYVAGHGREIDYFPETYKIPTVIAYAKSSCGRFPSVMMDDEKGGYEMGKYLISKGHTQIGIVTGVVSNMHAQSRLTGFQKALFESGIPYNPNLTVHGTWQRESGYQCAKKILDKGVSVIWCMNDQMACGVYDYLYEHNIRPGVDISIAGYDNMSEASYMYPRLDTCELPLREIGRHSAMRMIDIIEGCPEADEMEWIPCRMVEGKSVLKIS